MKITWALDVFGLSKTDASRIGAFLRLFTKNKSDLSVAYVATPQEVRLSTAFQVPEAEQFRGYPLSLLRKLAKESGGFIRPKQCHVFPSPVLSVTGAVKHLCKSLEPIKPDFIALQTHQRKGIQRVLLGSFAETLLHHSARSLLVFNPTQKLPNKISTIIFAEDFSSAAVKARSFIVELALQLDAKIVITHADYLYQHGQKNTTAETELYCRKIDTLLRKSLDYFRSKKVSAETRVIGSKVGVTEAILDGAKSAGGDLIVVAAQSSYLRALLGGSVTRKIVRQSPLPVMVVKS